MRAIGLAGQMHGATLLDGDGRVLRPCILWDDGRSAPQCAQLEAAVPALRAITGNAAMPGFTAPKLLWVRQHEPDVFARIRRVLLPKAWLRWRLCGEAIEEMSDASGTLWLDVARRRWSGALLAACGLDESQMPRLVEGTMPAGELRRAVGRALGLRAHARSSPAARATTRPARWRWAPCTPGDAFLSLGTSGVLWVTTAQPCAGSRARRARLLPRAAAHLAPDGRAAERRGVARVVGARARAATRRAARRTARAGATRRRRAGSCPT